MKLFQLEVLGLEFPDYPWGRDPVPGSNRRQAGYGTISLITLGISEFTLSP